MFTALNNTEKDIDPETKSAKFLKKILEMCPTLLTQQNHIGENPLHVAAKYGDIFAVTLLIAQCAKRNIGSSVDHHVDSESGFCGVSKQMLLRMKTKAGDTPLHESILMGHKLNKYTDQWWDQNDLAEILLKKDHSEVMYDRNAAGETPLYLAVKADFYSVVKNGLQNIDAQTTSTYYGGYDGKTILHEADSQQENSTECTEQEGDPPPKSNDSRNLETLAESNVNPRTPSINEESAKSLKNANYLKAEKGHDAV
ncbi:hypothetical protein FEM48_Zijuj07G0014000 [Ziziphus jujuba var. spinosa]|uniref:Uncharacterized protein n=1 Tax=Ziziphus jujuba var. spinosa TaxID=714518 RepID=A0A978V1M5_ZIZJJ|nr:hypothetical protein FEM48_Zijuj07G0014000 [Ziziphus jujuba var. spinosa]